jgi:centrosomal protein CEP290
LPHSQTVQLPITHPSPTQIEFLEVRLAEVMAYADIPPHMRPALADMTSLTGRGAAASRDSGGAGAALAASLSTAAIGAWTGGGLMSAGAVAAAARALEEVRAAVLEALQCLRSMDAGIGEQG